MSKIPALLFLDFDGVLNCSESLRRMSRQAEDRKRSGIVKPIPDPSVLAIMDPIDDDKVERVNRILEETGAKVVISSSWRWAYTMRAILQKLVSAGFRGEVVGTTPTVTDYEAERWRLVNGDRRFAVRGLEVLSYLAENVRGPVRVVVLDDCEVPGFEENLVSTTMATGLTDEHVEQAIKILAAPWDAPKGLEDRVKRHLQVH